MRYLIDGYNLAHKITLAAGPVDAAELRAARTNLLSLIAAGHGELASDVTIVFDTRRSRGFEPEQVVHGINVRFAIGEQADDLIERLIGKEANPKKLTVVSDDHRLQNAARRRNCPFLSCSEYLDHIEKRQSSGNPSKLDEKSTFGTVSEWLRAFEPEDSN